MKVLKPFTTEWWWSQSELAFNKQLYSTTDAEYNKYFNLAEYCASRFMIACEKESNEMKNEIK